MKKQMLKVFSAMLCIVLLLSTLPFTAFAVVRSGECGENASWSFDTEGTTLVISGSGDMKDYTIANAPWKTYRVKIKTVTISDEITSIGNFAFMQCTNLTSVTLPKKLTRIGESAFKACSRLETVSLPEGIVSIGESAFSNCSAMTEIIIPESVTSIGENAFYYLKHIKYPGKIEQWKNITGAENVSNTVILDCDSARPYYDAGECGENLRYIIDTKGILGITGEGNMYNYSENSPAPWTEFDISEIILPDGMTSIGNYAFKDFSLFESFEIPENVTTIGSNAFDGCKNLKSITIHKDVASIGSGFLVNCKNLQHIYYEGSAEQWNKLVGDTADSLTCSITFEYNSDKPYSYGGTCGDNLSWKLYNDGTLEIIGSGAIYDYSEEMPAPWSTLGDKITKVHIGDTVTYIGNYAFRECTKVAELTLPVSIKISNKTVCFRTIIDKVIFTKGTGRMQDYSQSPMFEDNDVTMSRLAPWYNCKSVELDENITYIGSFAFFENTNLKSIKLPDGIEIGNDAFRGCTALTGITANGAKIGFSAFSGCTEMEEIILDDSITSIGGYAFYNTAYYNSAENWSDGLLYIDNYLIAANKDTTDFFISKGTKLIVDNAFPNARMQSVIYEGSKLQWENIIGHEQLDGIVEFADKSESDEGSCNDSIKWKYTLSADGKTGTLELVGSGAMPDYCTKNDVPWSKYVNKINRIIVSEGITTVGSYAFASTHIEEIDLPDEVTTIGNHAFDSCSALKRFNIGKNVAVIGDYAFKNTGLTEITVPVTVSEIGDYVFSDCKNLKFISLPDGTFEISKGMFSGCSALEEITVPDSATTIGSYAFSYCKSLANITLPDGLKAIPEGAFSGCIGLTVINLPDSVTEIGAYAFSGCECLAELPLNENITVVGEWAFSECTGLTEVTIPSNLTSLSDYMFCGCSSLKKVNIPSTITEFPQGVFFACGFESFIIPESVTVIGAGAFHSCEKLESIVVPDSITEIKNMAFSYCGLKSVTIPGSVKVIGGYYDEASEKIINITPFQYCPNLENVTIADGVQTIGMAAFFDCPALIYIKIADSVTSIEHSAFGNCYELESVVLPKGITNIGEYAFYNCNAFTDIYYKGTETEWSEISVAEPNDELKKANVHYDYITVDDYIPEDNKIIVTPTTTTIKYGETLVLHSGIETLPEGMSIKWTASGTGIILTPSEDSLSCEVMSVQNGEITVSAAVVDAEGNPVLDEGGNEIATEQEITSKVNFWLKIISFFKNLFGISRIILQSI